MNLFMRRLESTVRWYDAPIAPLAVQMTKDLQETRLSPVSAGFRRTIFCAALFFRQRPELPADFTGSSL